MYRIRVAVEGKVLVVKGAELDAKDRAAEALQLHVEVERKSNNVRFPSQRILLVKK